VPAPRTQATPAPPRRAGTRSSSRAPEGTSLSQGTKDTASPASPHTSPRCFNPYPFGTSHPRDGMASTSPLMASTPSAPLPSGPVSIASWPTTGPCSRWSSPRSSGLRRSSSTRSVVGSTPPRDTPVHHGLPHPREHPGAPDLDARTLLQRPRCPTTNVVSRFTHTTVRVAQPITSATESCAHTPELLAPPAQRAESQVQNEHSPRFRGGCETSGSALLSQGVTPQVPSALVGLTVVFGMGTGVSPPLWPPLETRASKSEREGSKSSAD